MKIEFASFDEFIAEVVRARRVFQNTVRLLIDHEPLQEECITHRVVACATALLIEEDDSEYIIEHTEAMGINDAAGDAGDEAVATLKQKFSDMLPQEIQLRPGRLEA